jgi:8-oxo-dGTP pyrophosphatase MutT (NUDIX family)
MAGRRLVEGAVLTDGRGRIYVQRRSRDRALFPGCWDIVGGHVEPGERVLDALKREVKEETGWRLARTTAVVELLDWQGSDGIWRSEVDLLAEAEGQLHQPRLEAGKHDAWRWIGPNDVGMLLEGRRQDDKWVHEVVTRAFQLLGYCGR